MPDVERADPPWPLQKLDLALPRIPSTSSSLASFLRRCAPSLVDLRLDVAPSMLLPMVANVPISAPVQWRNQILKECTSLEILRLDFQTISDIPNPHVEARIQAAYNDALDANVELVRVSAPPQLRTIVITFFHVGRWDAQTATVVRRLSAWRRLDEAIVGLRRLESVVCIISRSGGLGGEKQIDLLRSLPEKTILSHQLLPSSESSENEYSGILVNGLPGACSAGLVRIAMVPLCAEDNTRVAS